MLFYFFKDKYRIKGHKQGWNLEKLTKLKGEDNYAAFEFYTTLESAVKGLLRLKIQTLPIEIKNPKDMVEAINQINSLLDEILEPLDPIVKIDINRIKTA